ncbi:MAG TPA: hypothetical protein VJV79_34960, partial [Polyangiaceae bacterium]|nr:hypothetical protein [Polyangiaceae bacterium]
MYVGEEAHPTCLRDLQLGEACAYPASCQAPLVCDESDVCALPPSGVGQCDRPGGRPPGDAEPVSGGGEVPAGSFLDTFGWRVADARCRRDESCSLTPSYPYFLAHGG